MTHIISSFTTSSRRVLLEKYNFLSNTAIIVHIALRTLLLIGIIDYGTSTVVGLGSNPGICLVYTKKKYISDVCTLSTL
jgi:hypothetical protein